MCCLNFKKLEDQEDDTSPVAGHGGPLRVQAVRLHEPNPVSQAFLDACGRASRTPTTSTARRWKAQAGIT